MSLKIMRAFQENVREYPEAAGQSFVTGDLVYLVAGKVTICADGDNTILGQAMQKASGVVDTLISVAVFDEDTRFAVIVNNTKGNHALLAADIGIQLYIAKVAAGNWCADVNDYGDVALWSEAVYPGETIGSVQQRIICGVIPGALQVDNSAIASSVAGLTATLDEVNYATDLSLNNASGVVLGVARSVTVAEMNAGHTIVPAVAGMKYRLNNVRVTPVGGNAAATAAATGIGVYNEAAGAGAKLAGFLLADLLQNKPVDVMSANTALLAGGASFAPNTANKAISVKATSAGAFDLITVVSFHIVLTYTLEL